MGKRDNSQIFYFLSKNRLNSRLPHSLVEFKGIG